MARVRASLRSLPFVEPDSVHPSLSSRQVMFTLKTGQIFDFAATREALGKAGYDKMVVVSEPKTSQ